MAEIFKVELISEEDLCCELSLPAGDHRLFDAYEQLRQPLAEPIRWDILGCRGYEYLVPYIQEENLLAVNELARRLSEMSDTQRSAFEGITKMELELRRGPFGVEDLLHYAQSVDLCHVVQEATDDASLGRFYAENGFIPEVEDLSDDVFELLDFAKLGRKSRGEEKGVFTHNGYVVLHDPIDRTPVPVQDQPQKPVYVFLLKLEPYPFENESTTAVELKLPASEEQLQQAVEKLAVGNWSEGLYTIEDSIIQDVLDESDTLVGLRALNTLANEISALSQDEIPKYKALLEVTQCCSVEGALEYIRALDQYKMDSNIRSYEELAREDVCGIVEASTADMLIRHLDLTAYGRDLATQEHGYLTAYGYLARNDMEPIHTEMQEFKVYAMDGHGATGGLPEGYVVARNQAGAERFLKERGVDLAKVCIVPEHPVEREDSEMNWFDKGRQMAEVNKKLYPPGTRIELVSMGNDPRPIEPGTRGTVDLVDDMGTLHCTFDNGRKLGVCLEEDRIRVIRGQEVAQQEQAIEPQHGPEMSGMSM